MPIRRHSQGYETGPFDHETAAWAKTTPEQEARAARFVAECALDADDARMLLGMLGLIDAPRAQWRRA